MEVVSSRKDKEGGGKKKKNRGQKKDKTEKKDPQYKVILNAISAVKVMS